MKNILKIASLILLTIFLNSCNDDNDVTKVSYPEIKGVNEEVMLIENETVKFELSGGDEKFTAETNNSNVASVSLKDKMLTIVGKATGMAEITVKSADKIKVVKVKVMGVPEAGVYMGTEPNVILKNSVKNSKGLWLLEVTGNPYNGKRIFVPVLPQNLEKNQKIQIAFKAFGIDGLDSGTKEAIIESVTQEIIKIKIGEYSIIIPKN